MLKYHDSMGNKFTMDIDCVVVYDYYASFSGPVVKTNMNEWENAHMVIWVADSGSPAAGHDKIGGEMYEEPVDCEENSIPPEWWPVENGNIAIHPGPW